MGECVWGRRVGEGYENMHVLERKRYSIPLEPPRAVKQLQMKRRRGLAVDLPAGGGLRGHYVLLQACMKNELAEKATGAGYGYAYLTGV